MVKHEDTFTQISYQIYQLIGAIFQLFVDIWHQTTLYQKLIFLDGLLAILVFIYSGILAPIIFNFYIIPRIEKKVGKKLEKDPEAYLYKTFLSWGRAIEISQYIMNRYKAFKKYNDRGLPPGFNNAPLKKVGYTIDMMSKTEIFFSWLFNVNCALTLFVLFVSPVLFLIVPAIKGLFFS